VAGGRAAGGDKSGSQSVSSERGSQHGRLRRGGGVVAGGGAQSGGAYSFWFFRSLIKGRPAGSKLTDFWLGTGKCAISYRAYFRL
jgi:hypothetical protein